jgi:hypothetical protein
MQFIVITFFFQNNFEAEYLSLLFLTGTGNIGNIPLVIIGAICRPDDNPFGQDSETCNSEGVAYISFGQWVCVCMSKIEMVAYFCHHVPRIFLYYVFL